MTAALVLAVMAVFAPPARAQQPLTDVLSFLLINRSIPTGDFSRDEQAAARMRDALVEFLQAELGTLPINSPASGFTYRLDPDLGANVRSSDSFGPFFMERSLTSGRQAAFGVAYTYVEFDNVDGRNLLDGTLVATASRFVGDAQPFDAETLTLKIRTQTVTLSGLVGLTDRLDVSAALPFVRIDFSGSRVDTYRGSSFVQATAAASATGFGDLLMRAKYNLFRYASGGVAIGVEARIATGDEENLLGGGKNIFKPRLIASWEGGRVATHGELGYTTGGVPDQFDFGGAVTFAASAHVTLVGEFLGRRISSGGQITEVIEPHPTLAGIETIRLSSTEQATTRGLVVGGLRWNIASKWVFSANVLQPVTTAGLNARWAASAIIDYSIGK